MTPLIERGSLIAVVAPCGIFNPERLETGLALLRAHGHRFELLPDLLRPQRYLASPDDQRAAQLQQALTAPQYSAVWIARGGFGLTRILHRLRFHTMDQRPVLGFSDVTSLLCALHRFRGGSLVHAPVLHSLAVTDTASIDHLVAMLDGESFAPVAASPWVSGTATGWLAGGNLCVLAALAGTPWQPDLHGAILVLEEIDEAPYRVDRLLQQLVSSKMLDGVAGVVVGDCVKCDPPPGADWSLRDVFVDHLSPLGIPVVGDAPFGHGPRNRPFRWGVHARLTSGETGALIVD